MKKTILITAGATREHIDPVRYITNASSGYQGIMLAMQALDRGYKVILILGQTTHKIKSQINLKVVDVVSADDMYNAAIKYFPKCDVAICAAAVGDYKVKNIATDKIKRTGDSLIIELIPNKDIAKELGNTKRENQMVIGFALETSNGYENALKKIEKKNLDYVVLNEITTENSAFNELTNIVSIINKSGEVMEKTNKISKDTIAGKILNICKKLEVSDKSKETNMWCVYMVECNDGTYYTGITTDVTKRIAKHNANKGAKYTKGRTPVTLVYSEGIFNRSGASIRERLIKKLSRIEKENLVKPN